MKTTKKFRLTINTDLGRAQVLCDSLEQCQQAWNDFRDGSDCGASDMLECNGDVRVNGVLTHRVHYNGRVEQVA